MNGDVNENRFLATNSMIMSGNNSRYRNVNSNYHWAADSNKHTLKEFEKEVYYAEGDYPNQTSDVCDPRFLIGNHEFINQKGRNDRGRGNYVNDQKG